MNEDKFKEIVYEKTKEIKELRKLLKERDEQIDGLRARNDTISRHLLAKDQTILQIKQKKAELSEDVFIAYDQRARLLSYLAAKFPSIIKVDLDAKNPDYADVLYIVLPEVGQIAFHLFKGQLRFLKRVPRMDYRGKFVEEWMEHEARGKGVVDIEWDYHTTEEKWDRFHRFVENSYVWGLDREREVWYPIKCTGTEWCS